MTNRKSRILIVDDEKVIRESLAEALHCASYQIDLAASAEDAIVQMNSVTLAYQVVITDLKMTGMTGHQLLHWIKKRYPRTEVVIVTAFATIENAVQAIKDGATDYITKPLDLFRFRKLIQQILERQHLLAENRELRNRLRSQNRDMIVGTSSVIKKVQETIDRVADTDATVLIQGESGTGKEVIARALHEKSNRKDKPFVVVNCAALPDTLLENELFGHEKEAFTGAVSLKKGRFEQANGGTIFLDEVTEMSLNSQSGFLRVLEDGCFHRIGGSDLIQVDVRVIAASNRNVQKACEDSKFRFDLFYRLNVVPIFIPPLRDRSEDVSIFVQSFLEEFAYKYNRPDLKISPEAITQLQQFSWPGNIRELKNAMERAVIICRDNLVDLQHFPDIVKIEEERQPNLEFLVGKTLRDIEEILIRATLDNVQGHRRKAAEILGISVRALQYKIKQYTIDL